MSETTTAAAKPAAPETNRSEVIREVLTKSQGQATYGTVKEQMLKLDIKEGLFNSIKSQWKSENPQLAAKGAAKKPAATTVPPAPTTPKPAPPTMGAPTPKAAPKQAATVAPTATVTLEESIAFVREAGGLTAARAKVIAQVAKLNAFLQKFEEVAALAK